MAILEGDDVATVLAAYNDYAPTATELEAWNAADAYSTSRPVTKIGLWGADLTDFNEECLISTECAAEDFTAWNGWAVGVDWALDAGVAVAEVDGVIIEDVMWGAEVIWTASANVLGAYDVTAVTVATPVGTGADVIDEDNQFGGWSGVPGTTRKAQFMFAFLDEADEDQALLQAEHEGSVWTTLAVMPATGTPANVNTAAFVFVGAVQLTVAATSAIALALLF